MSESETPEKQSRCNVCGKPSATMICEPCSQSIQGEAANKKRKIERKGRTDNEPSVKRPGPPPQPDESKDKGQ